MRRIPTIFSRELQAYFRSPLAYGLAAMYLLLINILIYAGTQGFRAGDPHSVIWSIIRLDIIFMALITPLVTMRLLAAERDSGGSFEILATNPVTDWDIVIGKYLASVVCLIFIVSPQLIYALGYKISGAVSTPAYDVSGVRLLVCCLGLIMLLALYAAVGVFASSLTTSQVGGALIGFVLLLLVGPISTIIPSLVRNTSERLGVFAEAVSVPARLEMLLKGNLDSRPFVLMISTTLLVLFLTVRVVESRKWR